MDHYGEAMSTYPNQDDGSFPIQKHQIISSESVNYLVMDFIGKGCFGKVAKCINLKTAETTAIKILKDTRDYIPELEMLQKISALNPEKTNLVRFIDNFTFQNMPCLAFEMLDTSLFNLVVQSQSAWSLYTIRPIMHQLLVAFEALKSIGVIHTDLKPDNIMLVNQAEKPFRVKLIDFGLAIQASEAKVGMIMQPHRYRAPEVMLGLPISEAIDMWGLGCVVAFLYFGCHLLNGSSTYQELKQICHLLGQPDDQLLHNGKNTSKYFCREQSSTNQTWRLKTPKEYEEATGKNPKISNWNFDNDHNLEEAVMSMQVYDEEQTDRMAFLSLLKQLLDTNAETRITPRQALQHSFVTMVHLEEDANNYNYKEVAFNWMTVCPQFDSVNVSDNELFPVQKHQIISSESVNYLVMDFIGEGRFGKVAKCINLKTAETTAIKILKDMRICIYELEMMQKISALNPEKTNLVRFIDNFTFQNMPCLAFEMLDTSLSNLVAQSQSALSLNTIRPIMHQLFVALEALKSIGVIHTDLKPDNIMLVNQAEKPFRVKLIDFGLAIQASEVKVGTITQAHGYRAPEVMLGLPISEAIDMWGLGCVVAFLYFGCNILNRSSTYQELKQICHLLGQPDDHLLHNGKNTSKYFCREQSSTNQTWRLKTPKEYEEATGKNPEISNCDFDYDYNLEDAVMSMPDSIEEQMDRMAFLSLLKQLLDTNAETRITPRQALQHSFVTMVHLEEDANNYYYKEAAFDLMTVCPQFDSVSVSDNELFPVQKHQIISGESVNYLVMDFIGEGCFGKVAKCLNLKTSQPTAIKILKDMRDYIPELEMLQKISALNPEKTNLVRFIDNFKFQNMPCLAFEMLDTSLFNLVVQSQLALSLNSIRPIMHQLFVAFEALKSIGVIHTDLKPDNIMLVNQAEKPFRVKLIDFGLAIQASEVKVGMIMQPHGYRAPEVMLGLPISEAIDMWGLGCVVAFLYFGCNLLNGSSTYHELKQICHLLGQPDDHLLHNGKNTSKYFCREQSSTNQTWRLKTPKEYEEATGKNPKISKCNFDNDKNLEEAVMSMKVYDEEQTDRMAFLSLLKQLLDTNAETRITPRQALQHSFVTMVHLEEDANNYYYREVAFDLMTVCPQFDSLSVSDNELLPVQKHQIISSESVNYLVMDFIGEGRFGEVAKCINLKTAETTAIKILKDMRDCIYELEMLQKISALNPEKTNLVRFIDNFTFQNRPCLAFEMLDTSLSNLVVQSQLALSLNTIRPIMHQLFVALEALKSIGVIHTDLKPDNVMLVNQGEKPFRVKLIDFGLAIQASEVKVGMITQAHGYRAPEVMLGLPISEAIDMWGLGSVMSFLYFGCNILKGSSTYQELKQICHLLGQPDDHLLHNGKNTSKYFCREQSSTNQTWRLKTPKEYEEATGKNPKISKCNFDYDYNLEDAVMSMPVSNEEQTDRMAFLSLLKQLLDTNAETRITPRQALQHSFVTMVHLEEDANNYYYKEVAFDLMTVCPQFDSVSVSDNELFPVQKHQIISGESVNYLVMDFIGEGCFGKVAKCLNLKTSQPTAIKILKDMRDYIPELEMLQKISALNPEKTNLVRFIDNFTFQNMPCLAFEMLDTSLFDLVVQSQLALSLYAIRPIMHQLLVAFEALKSIGVIHTDLKPDNIMLVNQAEKPFRVKLIDFGVAIPASEVKVGMIMQPHGYRAPEVMLGLPISEAIDMWGLGCVVAFLYFGCNLLNGSSTYHELKQICHLLGQPDDHLLHNGKNTSKYFCREQSSTNQRWRLKTPKEYEEATGKNPKISKWNFDNDKNLEEAVMSMQVSNEEQMDRMAFLSLLKQLLDSNAETRITPRQALQHSFVTMVHLEEDANNYNYKEVAFYVMNDCLKNTSECVQTPIPFTF